MQKRPENQEEKQDINSPVTKKTKYHILGCSPFGSSSSSSSCGFLAEDKVDDTGDEGEAEGDPGQDEAVSVPAIGLVLVEDVRVDGGSDHDAQAG